jgi:hypothetical protein
MALETTLQAITRTMRERSPPGIWEYGTDTDPTSGRRRYMVIAKSGDCSVVFLGCSPDDIEVAYLIGGIRFPTAAATVAQLGAGLIAVIDGEHGDRLAATTDYVGPAEGPYTIRVRATGPKIETLAAAVACAKEASLFGLYAGENVAYPTTFGTDGALLAFASFYAGCHPT